MSWTASPITPFVAVAVGCTALLLLLKFGPDGAIQERHVRQTPAATAAIQPTRIEVDGDAHAIRFYVDGKQVAMLDESGFKE